MLKIILPFLFSLVIPAYTFADNCDNAKRLVESGNEVFQKDKDKAYGFYGTAIEMCPGYSDAHFNMGLLYLSINDFQKAAKEFEKAVEIDPENGKAWTNLVYVLIEKGVGLDKGIGMAEKRLKIKQEPRLMAILARGIYRKGRKQEAVSLVLDASANDPAHKDKYDDMLQQMIAGKALPRYADTAPAAFASPAQEETEQKLPPLRTNTYAVIIGIDYRNRQDIPHLQYSSEDAKKVYNILTNAKYGGVPKENTTLLLNEQATTNSMKAALRKIKNWDGYIYVYYSGHGAPKTKEDKFVDGLLVPSDVEITDPETIEDTSIKISYLQELIDSSNAKGIMVAIDACFSGGGKSIAAKGGKPLVGMIVNSELIKPKGTGKVVITSSAANQQSWEDEKEIQGGIFSHYLIEGLKGGAGKDSVWIKVDELADYIKANVPKTARKLKGVEQEPQVSGRGDFAVVRNWERTKVMDVDMAKARLKSALEKGMITAGQLNRAMDELKTQGRSKTLESFLEGKIDENKFGELY